MTGGWQDRSILEAASWRLASELLRRHPQTLRLIRGHPAGGQADGLWIFPLSGPKGQGARARAFVCNSKRTKEKRKGGVLDFTPTILPMCLGVAFRYEVPLTAFGADPPIRAAGQARLTLLCSPRR